MVEQRLLRRQVLVRDTKDKEVVKSHDCLCSEIVPFFSLCIFKNFIYTLYKLNDSIVVVRGPPLSPGNQFI